MKASEQYFPVALFIILYKVILTFESVDEILKCDHLRWPNTVCARFTDSVNDAIKHTLGLW